MQRVFVDTGGWFAIQVPDDRWHTAATRALEGLVERRVRLVTSNLVVGETYTLLRVTHGSDAAWRFTETLDRSALVQVTRISERFESDAWELLRQYRDQPFSFVDGTSFALMRAERLTRAIAFDAHFAAAGFSRVPIDEGR
jgi:uncharacterized protein